MLFEVWSLFQDSNIHPFLVTRCWSFPASPWAVSDPTQIKKIAEFGLAWIPNLCLLIQSRNQVGEEI